MATVWSEPWIWIALYVVGALVASFVLAFFFDAHLAPASMVWPLLIPIAAIVGALMYAADLGEKARARFPLKDNADG